MDLKISLVIEDYTNLNLQLCTCVYKKHNTVISFQVCTYNILGTKKLPEYIIIFKQTTFHTSKRTDFIQYPKHISLFDVSTR